MKTTENAEYVVVLGSKPGARLPDVPARVVYSANAAVLLGIRYRERYGSRLIALVNSSEVYLEHLCDALTKSAPDEIVLIGESVPDAETFVVKKLGLPKTTVTVMRYRDRQRLLWNTLGWRAVLFMLDYMRMLPIRYVFSTVVPDLFVKRTNAWMSRSTGLNAMFLANERSPRAQIIVAGIGLQAGGHFYESTGPSFTEKTARVDRTVLGYWPRARRPHIKTTDDMMAEIGDVPKWDGQTFLP